MSELAEQVEVNVCDLVVHCLQGSLPLVRKAALIESQRLPPSKEIFDAILHLLEGEEEKDCLIEGFKALKVHGYLDGRTQTVLSSAMTNYRHNGYVAVEAIRTHICLQGDPIYAIHTILLLIYGLVVNKSWENEAKTKALNTLAEMKVAGNLAAPMLAQYVLNESESDIYRTDAVFALMCIDAKPEQVSVQLSKALSSTSKRLVSQILYVLPQIGITKDAVPFLIEALKWVDPDTKQACNRHYGMFMSGTTDYHETIVNVLASAGSSAQKALPMLKELLERSTENPRKYAWAAPFVESKAPTRGRPRKRLSDVDAPAIPTRFTSEAAKVAAKAALVAIQD